MYTVCIESKLRHGKVIRQGGRNRPTLSQAHGLALQWVYALSIFDPAFKLASRIEVLVLDAHAEVIERHVVKRKKP